MTRLLVICACTLVATGCGPDADSSVDHFPFATGVELFEPGEGAGYGAEGFPDNVLGPPTGAGAGQGATTGVLSLGINGEIVVELAEPVTDGAGPDLIVFENPFWVQNDPEQVWAEFGEVSVSSDGEVWTTFPCEPDYADQQTWRGCAGWNPVMKFDEELAPLDADVTGGDPFDLAEIGADDVRFVRIRDLAKSGTGPSAGFDLDAVGGIYR